jgi:serine/threonine protein kinase
VAKVVDFGIASNEKAAFKLTAAGVPFGTPEYISPEMAMGLPVDARADLYSLGVMLFEMVTGKLPFAGSPQVLLRAHVHEAVPSPTKLAPQAGIPSTLEAVIARAMAKTPEERFASAEEMRVALTPLLPVRRSGWWIAVLLVVATLFAASVWWTYFAEIGQTTKTAAEPDATSQPKPVKKSRRSRPPKN